MSDDTLPRLNDSEHEELETDIQIDEIAKALKELPNDKTPGSDGFTSNFFKFFCLISRNYYMTVFSTLSKMVCYQQINAEVLLL